MSKPRFTVLVDLNAMRGVAVGQFPLNVRYAITGTLLHEIATASAGDIAIRSFVSFLQRCGNQTVCMSEWWEIAQIEHQLGRPIEREQASNNLPTWLPPRPP